MQALGHALTQMVKTFRQECPQLQQSERTTVHGADAMLLVLQLAMADVSKQKSGEFKVALSDVLMVWKHLLLHKLHLQPPGAARLENYDLILEAYEGFLKRTNTVDLVDIFSGCKELRGDSEEVVSPVQLFEFLTGNTGDSPASSMPSTPSSKSRPCSSQVKVAVRRVFCSYLSLLINTKNDLALALTLDVPSRSLGRQTFTDLKHAAQNSSTSLFLALTSFVRAIQLGGKGYAPAESDPLRKHVKGLSSFVQFLDNLEEILGETPDPSVCGTKLVSAIRAALVKGCSGEEAVRAAAEETAAELKDRLCQLYRIQKATSLAGGTGISPARPKAYAVNHATAYGGRETVKLLMALLDEEALAPPCANKAELLSEDQPVLNGSEGTCVLTLFRSPEVSTGSSPEPLKKRVQSRLDLLKLKVGPRSIRSQFACTYRDQEPPLNRVLHFPSTSQAPTCVHPAPKPKTAALEVLASDKPSSFECHTGTRVLAPRSGNAPLRGVPGPDNAKMTKGIKRKQADVDVENVQRDNEPPEKMKQRTKTKAKKKLIAGQATLSSFFRV
ncbi:PCNA-interacting partner [Dunckerocampus dactyliophorus]|uniref:PCNA-interacting partner n=1 Tax=Dunckerocampus dactyliophorus TaxID=161453 RepID=UPI0024073672|nr:PCNA-interacting partner [Dunckerocampus dactyliophorus]XP_054656786.1 PCNA-interacting partner [Dunckerocampus dactyliophorus]